MTDERSLPALIRSYLDDDEIGLLPDDRKREGRQNTRGYGFAPQTIDGSAVAEALSEVATGLSFRLRGSNTRGPATFYAWYDSQAGRLMCSLSSAKSL
jgi:hypothetical protein